MSDTNGQKKRLMFVRFPYHGQDDADVTDWMIRTHHEAKNHPALEDTILHLKIDDTPITMTRNLAIEAALQNNVDLLLMIDNDMKPDLPGSRQKPFFSSTLDFMLKHDGPCVVAAPYCGPPPLCNVYVFRWANWMNDSPNPDYRLEAFGREEAAMWTGIQEVAALPTGLILIDMRAIKKLDPPYFYYEWKDRTASVKASTEDVAFTRDLCLAGVPVYVNWDSWAGHWKRYLVEKPKPVCIDDIRQEFVNAVRRGIKSTQVLRRVEMKDGRIVEDDGKLVITDNGLVRAQSLRDITEARIALNGGTIGRTDQIAEKCPSGYESGTD